MLAPLSDAELMEAERLLYEWRHNDLSLADWARKYGYSLLLTIEDLRQYKIAVEVIKAKNTEAKESPDERK